MVTAEVLIDNSSSGPFQAGASYGGESLVELVRSTRVVEPVVRRRRLYIVGPRRVGQPPLPLGPSGPDSSLFNGFSLDEKTVRPGEYELKIASDGRSLELTDLKTSEHEKANVGDSLGKAFGFRWFPQIPARWYGQKFDFTILTVREAADRVIGGLNVGLSARFMHFSFAGQDGNQAAGTLNDVLDKFVEIEGQAKRANVTQLVQSLDSQLIEAKGLLTEKENELESWQVKTITLPKAELPLAPGLQQTTPQGYSAYTQLRMMLEDRKRDRGDLAAAIQHADSGGDIIVDEFPAIPYVNTKPELTQVLKEYQQRSSELRLARQKYEDSCSQCTPNMPDLIAKVNEMRTKTIPRYAHVALQQLDQEIAREESRVAVGQTELMGIPERAIREEQLRREVDIQADIVTTLTKSYQAAKLSDAGASNDVAVFARAIPPLNATKNRAWLLIAMGAILGLGAGLGLAFLFDLTDKRVRYADQITAGLGLTILGVIPEIRRAKGETATAEEGAQVIEAFRTVRLNLSHNLGEGPAAFTVSSPSPGDGKSLVSSNLALSFAEAGYRTLLIDGDTRRGELHRTFGTERRPGLTDFLTGELGSSELLRPTSHPLLTLITGGSRKRNAPELLGSPVMRELMAKMRGSFDIILVDSPPLSAGIDPFVLGTITGAMLLVMRAGATERDLAEAKLQIVDQLPIRLLGAVLNDVRASMNDYKYYSYSYGYGAVDEGSSVPSLGSGQTAE